MQGGTLDLTQTQQSPPPEMAQIRATLATQLGVPPARRGPVEGAQQPAPPIVAAARARVAEVEIAEPTDLSMGPPQPASLDASLLDVQTEPEIPRPRRTSVGVAVVRADATTSPSGSVVLPPAGQTPLQMPLQTIDDGALAAAEETTGEDRLLGDSELDGVDDGMIDGVDDMGGHDTIEGGAATLPPDAVHAAVTAVAAAVDEPTPTPTPSEYWTINPGGALAPSPKLPRSGSRSTPPAGAGPLRPPAIPGAAASSTPSAPMPAWNAARTAPSDPAAPSVASAASRPAPSASPSSAGGAELPRPTDPAGLPSGDWLIALDPAAPDGWSEPFETVPPHQLADDPAAAAAAVAAPSSDARPRRPTQRPEPTPRPEAMPRGEPKVQIDPTLIEPLAALPDDGSLAVRTSSPELLGYSTGGFPVTPAPGGIPSTPPFAAPPPFGPPSAFGAPHGAPAYPLDPSYQMVPVTTLPAPRAVTAGGSGSGFIDPRYATGDALPVRGRRRHVIIVLATAIVAVVIGIVMLAMFTGKPESPSPVDPREAPSPVDKRVEANPAPAPAAAPLVPATPAPGTSVTPTTEQAAAPGAPATIAAPSATDAPVPPPTAGTCYASVSSQPSGAEILGRAAKVIGTTPQKVALPCGTKVELTIRKGRLAPVTRTITPTAAGVKLRVALVKQIVQVKVSSTPAGATITLNGRSLGVTPTTVKVPAFEPSTLIIAKDGYATGTEKVSPKVSGGSVHATLKKLERRPR
jgi:hypothetical protein